MMIFWTYLFTLELLQFEISAYSEDVPSFGREHHISVDT